MKQLAVALALCMLAFYVTAGHPDSLPDGKVLSYYENGKIRSVTHYKNGQLHGKFESYYANGTIK